MRALDTVLTKAIGFILLAKLTMVHSESSEYVNSEYSDEDSCGSMQLDYEDRQVVTSTCYDVNFQKPKCCKSGELSEVNGSTT